MVFNEMKKIPNRFGSESNKTDGISKSFGVNIHELNDYLSVDNIYFR